jgi:hypothetical protein
MEQIPTYRNLADDALVVVVPQLAGSERHATAHLVSALMEFERRRLHLALGYTSMFDYCVKALHLTEHEACNRIEVARAARRFAGLLERLACGDLSLTAIRLLAPHLTADNYEATLQQATHKTKEQIKLLVARLSPQPAVPSVVRKLPQPKPVPLPPQAPHAIESPAMPLTGLLAASPPTAAAPARRPIVAPLSEAQYKLQVTISAAARERLGQIQDLMRHKLPDGDAGAIVEHALEVLHAELLKKKAAEVARPRGARESVQAKGRHIPASVRRAVWRRDQGRCAFVGETGRRCGATGALEFHHVDAYAHGGRAIVDNIEMRCRAHNGFEWEREVDAKYGVAAPAVT